MIFIQPPIAFYIALSFITTWIAEKLQVLPSYLNPSGTSLEYYIMLVILVFLALIPSWNGVNKDEEIREKNK